MASKDRDMESLKRDIQSLEASVSRLGKEKKLLKDRLVDMEEQSQAANDKMGQMARAKNKMEELLDEMEYDFTRWGLYYSESILLKSYLVLRQYTLHVMWRSILSKMRELATSEVFLYIERRVRVDNPGKCELLISLL